MPKTEKRKTGPEVEPPRDPDQVPTAAIPRAILLGDIAIGENLITPDQLEEALSAQEARDEPEMLGEILLGKGHLRPDQLIRILQIQARRLSQFHEATQRTLTESLFGKVVIALGLADEQQVYTAIREQARRRAQGEQVRLGEILVESGALTAEQVRRVLHQQQKEVLFCPACHVQYNIVGYEPGLSFACRSCDGELKIPDPGEEAPVDPVTAVYAPGKATVRAGTGTVPIDNSHRTPSRPGELEGTVFGNYRMIRKIAHGGMGIVYQALQQDLDRVVAIKILSAGAGATEEELRRFHLEASAAANLNHPYIVPIHEVGEIEGRHYFTMDYVKGRNLAQMLREDGLSIRNALIITKKVAEALDYAHSQGMVHRDVKPANIIVDQFDNPRITDFGIVKDLLSDSKKTETGLLMGTPAYMSPEQAEGRPKIDGRADIYSLGAVLYELLTSRPPFPGEHSVEIIVKLLKDEPPSTRSLNPKIHRDVETICMKCLQKDPNKRYPTAAELLKDIDRYLNGETILARPVPWWEKLWRKILRNKPVSITAAIAVLIILVISGIAIGAEKARHRKVQEYVEHARKYLADGDFLPAKEELTKALAIEPRSRDALAGLDDANRGIRRKVDTLIRDGRNFLRWERYEAAEQRFLDALELDPESKEAHDGLDEVRKYLVDKEKVDELTEESKELLRKGLDLAGEARESPPEEARKKYVDAVILLRQAVAKAPREDAAATETRGALFDVLLEFADLATRCRTFDMASFLLSEATFLDGDPERLKAMRDALERKRRKHKGYTEYLDQGREYLSEGDYESAIPAIQQAIQIAETEEALEALGQARYLKGITEGDARADEKEWEDALAAYRLALENASEADRMAAEAKCTKASEEACSPLLGQAKDLWGSGKTEEATSLLLKVLEIDPAHRLAQRMLADLERTEQAPEGHLYVPGGMFALSSDLSGRRRFVASFYMDRHEVTNREYAEFVADRGYERKELWDSGGWDQITKLSSGDGSPGPLGWTAGAFPEGMDDHPVTGVSWYEARAYARWKGERLPSEWEWEKAASDDEAGRRKYPWGETWVPPAAEPGPRQSRPVGENDDDESPFGVRDLGGNVSEWTVGDGLAPIIKGGSYLIPLERYARCSFRGVPPPLYRSAGTGFRCVRDIQWKGRP